MEKAAEYAAQILQKVSTSQPIEPYICVECGATVQPIVLDCFNPPHYLAGTCQCVQRKQVRDDDDRRKAERARRIERLFSASRLGTRFMESTFATWERRQGTQTAYNAAQKFVGEWEKHKADGDGLIFCGPVGTGKSHLAAAITHELLNRGETVIFQNVPELFTRIRATYSRDARETEGDLLAGLESADLLVLDDLGAEKWSEATEARLYQIIDMRYRHKRPLIATTNAEPGELEHIVGARAHDRLLEMCLTIQVSGASYRKKQALERTSRESLRLAEKAQTAQG